MECIIRVPAERVADELFHRERIAEQLRLPVSSGFLIELRRRSLDARSAPPQYELRYEVFPEGAADRASPVQEGMTRPARDVSDGVPVLVVGMGPAGLFAALRLIESGLKPVLIERGKPVRERRRDLAAITKLGMVNPESNYCFGEGGAGTFSDGKLYTRSTKRGSVERVLRQFVAHGATPDILIDTHPHIGTNKLPGVVEAIRDSILRCGGEIHFHSAVSHLSVRDGAVSGVVLTDGRRIDGRAVILATGHSARDIFEMLDRSGIRLERKPFALGVRVEHPQEQIDLVQYRLSHRPSELPPASYALVAQCDGRGVFSFCMCPGGIICPAATADGEIVVNGWSPSRRNSPFANSGIVVQVEDADLAPYDARGVLAGLGLQSALERRAATMGGGKQVAPAQRLTDFLRGRVSSTLPRASYIPGLCSADLSELFPEPFTRRLRAGFTEFQRRRPGFITEEAVVVAVESRTSSPVRIPRDPGTRFHPDVRGLAPAGEGAGYAGGIVSAALDGEAAAAAVAEYLGVGI